uniref:CMP domain-containing protein n=1 Tax=Xiphophorus couchianus TaxID=32473 RepID=A0A3B5KR87_9TELE
MFKHLCLRSVKPQMDPLCDGIKKTESSDLAANSRPPPAKMARLEQHNSGTSTPERTRQGRTLLPVFCVVERQESSVEAERRDEHAEFVLIKRDLLFNQLTEMALLALGYSHSSAAQTLYAWLHVRINFIHLVCARNQGIRLLLCSQ